MTKNWFPIINYKKCSACLTCLNFCPHGVFILDKGKVKVIQPENCVEFCEGCKKICPNNAIRYSKNKNDKKDN